MKQDNNKKKTKKEHKHIEDTWKDDGVRGNIRRTNTSDDCKKIQKNTKKEKNKQGG